MYISDPLSFSQGAWEMAQAMLCSAVRVSIFTDKKSKVTQCTSVVLRTNEAQAPVGLVTSQPSQDREL